MSVYSAIQRDHLGMAFRIYLQSIQDSIDSSHQHSGTCPFYSRTAFYSLVQMYHQDMGFHTSNLGNQACNGIPQ